MRLKIAGPYHKVESEARKANSAHSQIWGAIADYHFGEEEKEQLASLCITILDCCKRTWACVKDILCDDSPEGHLPEDLEKTIGLNSKELLSYSFRAINDSR